MFLAPKILHEHIEAQVGWVPLTDTLDFRWTAEPLSSKPVTSVSESLAEWSRKAVTSRCGHLPTDLTSVGAI